MADFIYNPDGDPQGFRLSNHVYDLAGTPLGRVWAEKVYDLHGQYVGALVNNMVVDKPFVSRRALQPVMLPTHAPPPSGAERRRPVGTSYPDVFHLLMASCVPEDETVS
jgi:hypothetical protein